MGWFSKKNGNGSTEIPEMLLGRLSGKHEVEALVLGAIQQVMAKEYDVSQTCRVLARVAQRDGRETVSLAAIGALREALRKRVSQEILACLAESLIGIIQRDGREPVAKEASDLLVVVLRKGSNAETINLMIKQGLFAANERNAEMFMKILDCENDRFARGLNEIKVCVLEMLARFSEKDVSPEAMDMVEAVLLERCLDEEEDGQVRNSIKNFFGKNRNGRPKIVPNSNGGEKTARQDETVAIETEAEFGAEPAKNPHEAPTRGMDVLAGWMGMLQHRDESKRRLAARSLEMMAERSTSKETVAKIATALYDCGSEFSEQHRKVLNKLDGMPLGDIRNTPTMPPMRPPAGNGNRNGGGPVKLRR